jgi:dGTPase
MAIVESSRGRPRVEMSQPQLDAMTELRRFMFERVYLSPQTAPDRDRAERIISNLFEHYSDHPDELPEEYQAIPGSADQRAADYVAGMTDGYALNKHLEIYGE